MTGGKNLAARLAKLERTDETLVILDREPGESCVAYAARVAEARTKHRAGELGANVLLIILRDLETEEAGYAL